MKKIKKYGFTLIEVIVSLTILSLILVSVLSIFSSSSRMSLTADINRAMQENVKNIVEHIAEDIRINGINICNSGGVDCHNFSSIGENYITSDTLYVGGNSYYIARENSSGGFSKVINISDCRDINIQCFLVKNGIHPLSNSWIDISSLSFKISKKYVPKVSINFEIIPSAHKGIPSAYVKKSRLLFQTTISERIIKTK